MKAEITPTMWLVARLRREQGRSGVRPTSHRPGGHHLAGAR